MLRGSIALTMLAMVTLSSAQNLQDRDYKLRVNVELVQLPVSVLDKQGLAFRGLRPEHFTVYEDKVLQNISLFKQEDIPLSVGFVIDTSGSMLDKLDRLNNAAMTFIRESNPEDQRSVVSFGDEVFLEEDFTGLSRTLAEIPSDAGTAFYDAVFLAAKHLQLTASYEKKVLIVISDGEDNKSKYTLEQVLNAVGKWKITVYTVGLFSSGPPMYGLPGNSGKGVLKQLAEISGGASFFPKNVNEVETICTRIAHDLRNQYTIGYRPTNETLDGSWRKVVVRIKPPKNAPKLKVRSKQGYYATDGKPEPVQKSMK
jgi:Ca-activated chloride channel family protein